MQRRAAAVYATIFVLLAAGAYIMIGVAEEPAVTIEDPDVTVSEGESITVDGRTYNASIGIQVTDAVGAEGREATLQWVNASEKQTATLENNTELPVIDVSWPTQTARVTTTLENGSTVSFEGSKYTVKVGEDEFTLVSDEQQERFVLGDTFAYKNNETTVVAANKSVTLAWGESYTVTTQTPTNDAVEFRETFNVSNRLRADPSVDNETVSREDGREYVVYRNGTTQLLSKYLPDPEVTTFAEGEVIRYNTAPDGVSFQDVTIEDVSAERVLLGWRAAAEHSVVIENGANVTVGPNERQLVAHFPDNETLELSTDLAGYQDKVRLQDAYWQRIIGLWGISIVSGLAAVFILAGAYLPSRY